MRLESAIFSSRSGLDAHGQAIAVVGDNIANANTTAFKTSRTEFADLFSDTSQGEIIPSTGQGVRYKMYETFKTLELPSLQAGHFDAAITGNDFS